MVRIIDYKTRQREDGTEFYTLEIQGGIEMIRSNTTGQFYATSKKAHISTTFDEKTCMALLGSDMPGRIVRTKTDPYNYTIKDTGEIVTLEHKYIYLPDDVTVEEEKTAVQLEEAFM